MKRTVIRALFYFLLIVLTVSACSGRHEIRSRDWVNPFPKYENKGQFIKTGEKKFILDSLTSLKYPIIQYAPREGLIIGFTSYDCSFVLFDYRTLAMVRKIKVSADPVSGIGRIPNSFEYDFNFISNDSIYLFNSGNGRIVLLDSTGRIRRKYSVAAKNPEGFRPRTNFGELMEISDQALFLNASPGMNILKPDYSGRGNLLATLNLGTGVISYSVKYPELYKEAFWGEHLYEYYSTYNRSQDCLVCSFPIDHNIYVYGPSGSVTKYYAGSKYIDSVTPYLYSVGNIDKKLVDEKKEVLNYIAQRSYYRIYYDPFAKLYYRFVTGTSSDPVAGKSTPFSIIVLDEKFREIAEQQFDAGRYSEVSMFVTGQGLNLQVLNSDEDQMTYDIFTFKKDTI